MTKAPGFSDALDEFQQPRQPDGDAQYRKALGERCVRAVEQIIQTANRETLATALGAPTDLQALARAVAAAGPLATT